MPMNQIRVHLGPMPRMLRSVINDLLASEPDVAIVGNSQDGRPSFVAASAERADVLVTSQPSRESDATLAGRAES